MTIYLVRHGKDDETIRGGWSNHGLMPVGVEQVNKLAKEMVAANMNIDYIYSSDLQRTKETSEILSKYLKCSIEYNAGLSPAEALNTVNDELCRSNPESMFATVFAAVLDVSSGTLHYANAGHTRPVIFGNGAKFLNVDPGIALGLFDDADIINCSVTLENNSGILIYTDSATETVNAQNEFFGEKRLLYAVSETSGAEQSVKSLSDSVWSFADGAEQFDDYTVLALYYSGNSKRILKLNPELTSLSEIQVEAQKNAAKSSRCNKIMLVCEEVFVNIVSYSGASCAEVSFENSNGRLTVEFSDDGVPFNPLSQEPQEKEFEDLEIGGMGIGLIKQIADNVEYRYENNMNILTLEFDL